MDIEQKQAELDQRESRLNLMEKDLIQKASDLDEAQAKVREELKRLGITTEENDFYDFVKCINNLLTKYIYHRGNSEGFMDVVASVLSSRKIYRNDPPEVPPKKK